MMKNAIDDEKNIKEIWLALISEKKNPGLLKSFKKITPPDFNLSKDVSIIIEMLSVFKNSSEYFQKTPEAIEWRELMEYATEGCASWKRDQWLGVLLFINKTYLEASWLKDWRREFILKCPQEVIENLSAEGNNLLRGAVENNDTCSIEVAIKAGGDPNGIIQKKDGSYNLLSETSTNAETVKFLINYNDGKRLSLSTLRDAEIQLITRSGNAKREELRAIRSAIIGHKDISDELMDKQNDLVMAAILLKEKDALFKENIDGVLKDVGATLSDEYVEKWRDAYGNDIYRHIAMEGIQNSETFEKRLKLKTEGWDREDEFGVSALCYALISEHGLQNAGLKNKEMNLGCIDIQKFRCLETSDTWIKMYMTVLDMIKGSRWSGGRPFKQITQILSTDIQFHGATPFEKVMRQMEPDRKKHKIMTDNIYQAIKSANEVMFEKYFDEIIFLSEKMFNFEIATQGFAMPEMKLNIRNKDVANKVKMLKDFIKFKADVAYMSGGKADVFSEKMMRKIERTPDAWKFFIDLAGKSALWKAVAAMQGEHSDEIMHGLILCGERSLLMKNSEMSQKVKNLSVAL